MVEDCGTILNDPLFGLHLADLQTPDVFGSVTALARSAPTFRDGVKALVDYLPVFQSPEATLRTSVQRNVAEIQWVTHGDLNTIGQPKLHGFAIMLKTLEMLGGPHFRPLHLKLDCELPAQGVEALQARAGCRVLASDLDAIAVPADLLDRPIATSNSLVFALLDAYLDRARTAAAPSLETQIEAYARSALPSGACTLERCAAKLGVSARKLQSVLKSRSLSFSEIVERQRMAIAQEALRRRRCSLDEIALGLGYSDQTCFGRAFKRWTGLTPRAYRDRQGDA
jgi:AraC-like DNA-binding protein